MLDVAAQVERIGGMLRTLLGSRIALIVGAQTESCFVDADPGQFETALVNLAVSARDAMDSDGKLTISLRVLDRLPGAKRAPTSSGDYVALAISDTGAGIAPEAADRMFEPFFTTKEVGEGTGLGLSQAYGFIKQSSGEIEVQSTVGAGATFTVHLPAASATAEPSSSGPPQQGVAVLRGRILVVDDDLQVGEFATQLLWDLGYEAHYVTRLAAADPAFDRAFSDVIMPGMNGLQLGRAINARWPQMPVVLTSGYSHIQGEDGHHGFPLLRKPYAVEDLFRRVSTAGRHRSGGGDLKAEATWRGRVDAVGAPLPPGA